MFFVITCILLSALRLLASAEMCTYYSNYNNIVCSNATENPFKQNLSCKNIVIKDVIDLEGKKINLTANSLICIKRGGAIVNGTLIGHGTRFSTAVKNSLGVKLEGTWCIDKVNDIVFSRDYLSDDDIIGNLNVLQSDTVDNELTITRDYNVSIPKSGGSGLLMSSNSKLLLYGTLTLTPNDYKSYNIINIQGKENVCVSGGRIVGDVGKHRYIDGTTSEWGMGVNISESNNVLIENVTITHCTGDGIYISGGRENSVGLYEHSSKNIYVSKVTCDDNRRQGMSIIHVDGLTVRNSRFVNTGQTEGTAPSAGIDIEPNVSNDRNMSVRNVVVDRCRVANNKGMAIATNNTHINGNKKNYENLLFSNCDTDGLLKAQSDGLTFRNCKFKEVRVASVHTLNNINFLDCTINGGYGIIIYTPSTAEKGADTKLLSLSFKGCTISTCSENTQTDALISCYQSYIPNIENVTFEKCRLKIPGSKKADYKLTDYPFLNNMTIRDSKIIMRGRSLDSSGIIMDGNNKIYCKKVF